MEYLISCPEFLVYLFFFFCTFLYILIIFIPILFYLFTYYDKTHHFSDIRRKQIPELSLFYATFLKQDNSKHVIFLKQLVRIIVEFLHGTLCNRQKSLYPKKKNSRFD